MQKNHLSKTGLSMTQAQSASNLANQKALSIKDDLAHWQIIKSSVKIDGNVHVMNHGDTFTNEQVTTAIMDICEYRALQAFLMHNVNAKAQLLEDIEDRVFDYQYPIEPPERPVMKDAIPMPREFNPLSAKEHAEYLHAEAYAAHIGQFIHNSATLHNARANYHDLMNLDMFKINKRTDNEVEIPIIKEEMSSKDALDALHESLSKEHRKYEQKVNYFKSKIKNMLNDETQRIADQNSSIEDFNSAVFEAYRIEHQAWADTKNIERSKALNEFNAIQSANKNYVSALRIEIPEEHKELLDSLIETGDIEQK